MVVLLSVSVTYDALASIIGCDSRSIRLNEIPWFVGAGLKFKVTLLPVCKPTPLIPVSYTHLTLPTILRV